MRHSRKRILNEIGKGIEGARENRLHQQGRFAARSERANILTLKGAKIVPPEFLEEAKKRLMYDFADALHRNNLIKWTLYDEYDPIMRGNVKIEGTLLIAAPEGR